MGALIIVYLALAVFAVVMLIYNIIFIVTIPQHLNEIADSLDDIAATIKNKL